MVRESERPTGRDVTASIDERGRLTIKQTDRKALGIDGQTALLDLKVTVLELEPDHAPAMNTDGGAEPDEDGGGHA